MLIITYLASIHTATVQTTHHERRTKATHFILKDIAPIADTFVITQSKMIYLVAALANVDATACQAPYHIGITALACARLQGITLIAYAYSLGVRYSMGCRVTCSTHIS
jgi:hypothetical protein